MNIDIRNKEKVYQDGPEKFVDVLVKTECSLAGVFMGVLLALLLPNGGAFCWRWLSQLDGYK